MDREEEASEAGRSEPPTIELLSEAEGELESEGVGVQGISTRDDSAALRDIIQILESGGLQYESTERVVRAWFPAGRATRSVDFMADALDILRGEDLSKWRFTERYDGIYHSELGIVEAVVQGRGFFSSKYWLEKMAAEVESKPTTGVSAEDGCIVWTSPSGSSMRFGQARGLSALLLGAIRPFPGPRKIMTLSLRAPVQTVKEADHLLEKMSDALFFQISRGGGPGLALSRTRPRVRGRNLRPGTTRLTIPNLQFQHEPMLQYQAGLDGSASPLIRYWAFYQVIEYFFPYFAQQELTTRVARKLKDPAFDVTRIDHVSQLVAGVAAQNREAKKESEQLRLVLASVLTDSEVRELVQQLGLSETVSDKKSDLTSYILSLKQEDGLVNQLAQRVYDVRCQIVHSKSVGSGDGGPGLLPGTAHEELVSVEIPLVRSVAELVLIATAEPLSW